jgi:thioesterase domain-containing protein
VAKLAEQGQKSADSLMALDQISLERTILETIPMARAMGVTVVDYDGNRIALSAPLAPNVNDKGCAFGGSLASLMTLAAWGLVNLKLADADIVADVFVQDSAISYLNPVWDALTAEAAAEPGQDWDQFIRDLRERGKARITMMAEVAVAEGGGVACRMFGKFVAKRSA